MSKVSQPITRPENFGVSYQEIADLASQLRAQKINPAAPGAAKIGGKKAGTMAFAVPPVTIR